MYLRFRKGGVDEVSAVVDIDDVLERDLAHRDIDLDLGKGAAEGVGIVANGKGRLGGDVLGIRGVVLCGHRKFLERHEHRAVAAADDVSVDNIHVGNCLTGELCRVS